MTAEAGPVADLTVIEPMLAELSKILRAGGFTLDIGDGELHLYAGEAGRGQNVVAALRWDDRQGLVAERWKVGPGYWDWSDEDDDDE